MPWRRSRDFAQGGLDTSPVELVDELLKAGQIEPAKRITEAILDPNDKAERLASVASRMVAAGDPGGACALVAAAYTLMRGAQAERLASVASRMVAAGDPGGACALVAAACTLTPGARFAEEAARVLAEAGNLMAVDCLLDERWGEARSRQELLELIPLAEPLVARAPEAGVMVHDAIRWVEATLAGV